MAPLLRRMCPHEHIGRACPNGGYTALLQVCGNHPKRCNLCAADLVVRPTSVKSEPSHCTAIRLVLRVLTGLLTVTSQTQVV